MFQNDCSMCRAPCTMYAYGWTNQSQIGGFLQCMKNKRLGEISVYATISQWQYPKLSQIVVVVFHLCVTVLADSLGEYGCAFVYFFCLFHMPEPSKRRRLVLQYPKRFFAHRSLYIIAKLLDCCYCYNFKRFFSLHCFTNTEERRRCHCVYDTFSFGFSRCYTFFVVGIALILVETCTAHEASDWNVK